MKPALLFLLSWVICFTTFAQRVTVNGKVTDQNGKPVAFANMHVKNTTNGASANSEGDYSLALQPGQYDLQFRAVGYKQETRHINLEANTTLNITLSAELYELKTVTINASGEDPAYAIIRKAIKKRKAHLSEIKAYTCEVYIKGL